METNTTVGFDAMYVSSFGSERRLFKKKNVFKVLILGRGEPSFRPPSLLYPLHM